jgi:hypothetical protein
MRFDSTAMGAAMSEIVAYATARIADPNSLAGWRKSALND